MPSEKDTVGELAYQAIQAQKIEVHPTSKEVIQRYKETKHWRLFGKECVLHLVRQCNPATVCDFGCGDGELSAKLAHLGYRVTGIDITPEYIEMARQRASLDGIEDRVEFINSDATGVTLPSGTFDCVIAQSVLHHMDLQAALDTIHDLLKPGGHIVIREPVAFSKILQWFRDRLPVEKDISPNERQLGAGDLRIIANRFHILDLRYYYVFARLTRLLPVKWRGDFRLPVMLLHRLDALLLRLPGMGYFAGNVVILGKKT